MIRERRIGEDENRRIHDNGGGGDRSGFFKLRRGRAVITTVACVIRWRRRSVQTVRAILAHLRHGGAAGRRIFVGADRRGFVGTERGAGERRRRGEDRREKTKNQTPGQSHALTVGSGQGARNAAPRRSNIKSTACDAAAAE